MHISSVTVSALLDPGLRIHRPFHVAPYLRYSSAYPPHLSFSLPLSVLPSFFLILSLSTGFNSDSDHEFSNPFPRSGGGRRNRHEKSMESSLAARLKSPESHRDADSTGKPVSENGSIDLRTLLRFGWRELWCTCF